MSESDEGALYAQIASAHRIFSLEELKISSDGARDLAHSLDALVMAGRAILFNDETVLSDAAWLRLVATARRVVTAYHKKHPFELGMPVSDLALTLPKAAAFTRIDPVIDRLTADGILLREPRARVRLPTHAVVMPAGWKEAAGEMLEVYAAAGLQPPSSYNFQANYPRHINVRAILGILTATGALVQLEDEIYIDAVSYTHVKKSLHRIAAASGGVITVGAVRDALGSTRKFVLPLLELMNAEGFTRREGDVHFLVETAP